MKEKLIIYGAGNRGKNLCELLMEVPDMDVFCVVDSDPKKWGKKLCGCFEIKTPETLRDVQGMRICITAHNSRAIQAIREKLDKEYQYDMGLEVGYEELVWPIFERDIRCQVSLGSKQGTSIIFDSYMGLGLGGIEAWTRDISTALVDRGWKDVRILSDQSAPPFLGRSMPVIDRAERVEDNGTEDGKKNFRNLVGYFMKMAPCTIITSRPNVELMAACTVKRKYPEQIKVISVIHMGTLDTYRRYALFKEYVDLYIGVSQDIKDGMLEQGIAEDKVTAMACPFSCDKFLHRSYTTDRRSPICIGYAGRLDSISPDQKRMDLILSLIGELADRHIHFKMEIAGDGPAKEAMERSVKEKGLEQKITFLGSVDREDIPDFWKRQDICINLSDFEGRSISVIEAMGNGTVPIVTLTSGIREDIEDGKSGYHVPIGDYRSMADRIQYLEKDRIRIKKMGQAAHDMIYPKSRSSSHLMFWEGVLKKYGQTRSWMDR